VIKAPLYGSDVIMATVDGPYENMIFILKLDANAFQTEDDISNQIEMTTEISSIYIR
jgi:hypothetical protein